MHLDCECHLKMSIKQSSLLLYDGWLRKHGSSVWALGWGSVVSQERRFEVLTEISDLAGSTVLDVGCGFGNLYDYLQRRRIDVRYTGFDWNPAVIETARRLRPDVAFELVDILEGEVNQRFAWVLASGILHMSDREHAYSLISRMFKLAERGVAFNMLHSRTPEPSRRDGDVYHDPQRVMEFCRGLGQSELVEDYFDHDFTVYVRRDPTSLR